MKNILISGASMAGLSCAFLLNQLGYKVTIVEMAEAPRINGAAVDLKGNTVEVIKRMGLFEQLKAHRLQVEKIFFKHADDSIARSISINQNDAGFPEEEIEIERDKFVEVLMGALKDKIRFIFNDRISALNDTTDQIEALFESGNLGSFDLVVGCDGMHSNVRKIWFGEERNYAHYLGAYFSISIVNKLLVAENTMEMFNVPGKSITLNAYNNKTDVIFCYLSEQEISYDYRDQHRQRSIIREQFAATGWRSAALLDAVEEHTEFYFDKFCQIKMPSWTKGRVVLLGDAAYCASPAAGMGASLAIEGAAVLAEAMQKHNGDLKMAFQDYNQNLRPLIEETQARAALNVKENFIPRTEEEIIERNLNLQSF